MKILVTVFSLVWFLVGIALLALVIAEPEIAMSLYPAPAAQDAPPSPLWQTIDAWLPWLAGFAWVVIFLMPALGFAALGSVLDKLDRRDVTPAPDSARRERAEPPKKRPAAEKVEPTIGEL